MGLQNATILDGGIVAFSAGTSKTLTTDAQPVVGGIHLIDASVTDIRIRPTLTCKVKQATVNQVTGKWGSGVKQITLTRPKILADGTQKFPSMYIKLADHPELSTAEIQAFLVWAAQIIKDPDFQAFWEVGSLA